MVDVPLLKIKSQRQFLYFAIISGIGWLIDFLVMTAITLVTNAPFYANIISASLAVIFVFCVSTRRLFINKQGVILNKFIIYFIFNVIIIVLASYVISLIYYGLDIFIRPYFVEMFKYFDLSDSLSLVIMAVIAKLSITPFTLYINFVFMKNLIEGRFYSKL